MNIKHIKKVLMLVMFSGLLSTFCVVVGFGVYPGPDTVPNDEGLYPEYIVHSVVKGWYDTTTPIYHLYEDAAFGSSRSVGGIGYSFEGNMKCHYRTSGGDVGEYEFEEGVNVYSGAGYDLWVEWIESWTYSKFNFLGYVFPVSSTAYSHAWPV